MSKESGGFLRKVARFVANPTTDWTELDSPGSGSASGSVSGESEYAKTEIKAMIERKRRNDFVRKRELDMLRKIRREGLSPDNALTLSSPSNLDPDSRPQNNGTRSDAAVKAKIDEIELQMVGSAGRSPAMQPAAQPSAPGRLADPATTAPNALTVPAALRFEDEEPPQISQEVLDLARSAAPRMPAAQAQSIHGGLLSTMDVQVVEVAHDPALDEAVIAFANADFDQCERSLLELVQPGASRHNQADTWLVLFDLYRTLDLPQKFDSLAVSFAQKFGVSAPQWYSLPQKVAAFLTRRDKSREAGQAAAPGHASLAPANTEPSAQGVGTALNLEGWIAPERMDADAAARLRIEVLQMPRPWIMDWHRVKSVTPEGAGQLVQLMRLWARETQELIWIGAARLLDVLGEAAPPGVKDADPAYWMLRLEVLRLCNLPVQFDEVAIDYCVTYELSPPSWEPASCRVREQTDAVMAHTRPLCHVSDITTSFVESQLQDDEIEFIQVAALNLSGQLVGDIGQTLNQLDDQLGSSVTLEIDCEHLLRVDFIAAGDLLNWVLARRAEDRQVVFLNPHRLIALFFGAMGINEHAKVKLQTI